MALASIKAVFPCEVKTVWEVVTSTKDIAWRSDLSRIEVINDRQFVEYTTSGYATTFTVTCITPCRRWEFDLENDNMRGHWTGVFQQKDGSTEITFTENVQAKKLFMKPFLKAFLQKQQKTYVRDLRNALTK